LLEYRAYGGAGPALVLVHGGPGAWDYLAPLAKALSSFRVFEPFQRRSGTEPLTVARHVADLHEFVEFVVRGAAESRTREDRPIVLGHSWGAMLALAHAAKHPEDVRALVLVGCGTFDTHARALLEANLDERCRRHAGTGFDRTFEAWLSELTAEFSNADERMREAGLRIRPLYNVDMIPDEDETVGCDARGHAESWADMCRLQEEGVYPAAFSAIRCPVLCTWGEEDPHPGAAVADSLAKYVPQLERRAWPNCGHEPWAERAGGAAFAAELATWMMRHA